MLAQPDESATTTYPSFAMVVLGLGLAMVMQVLVLAVQNAVDYRNMGVATASSLLFRQVGGSIGIAAFGAIFTNRLRGELTARLPPGVHPPKNVGPGSSAVLPPQATGPTCKRSRPRSPGLRGRLGHRRRLLRLDVLPARDTAAEDDAAARRGSRRRGHGREPTRVSDDVEAVQLEARSDWRDWLERNHETAPGVWLVTWKKAAGRARVDYDAAVEEALCFGWVDSKSRSVDGERTSLYFTPRKRKSAWSASNVARVEKLEAAGLLQPAGRRVVEEARLQGTWPE
jgi:hypothetical protein